jgi:hypothetical protein
MKIDAKLFSQSVASLDSDLIDLDDVEGLEDAAYVAAFNLCNNNELNIGRIVSLLKRSIAGTDSNEFALLLTQTTNVDWLFDEETFKSMQLVTEKLLEGIEYYSKNA